MRFCPKCGKGISKGEFCKDCSESLLGFKEVTLTYCLRCNSYTHRGKWTRDSLKNALIRVVSDSIVSRKKLKIEFTLPSEITGKKIEIPVIIDDEYEIPATILFTVCPKCSLLHTRYFEGIIQVRNVDTNIMDFIHSEFEKEKHKGVFITKQLEIKDGYDLYVSENKFIPTILKRLINKFGGESKSDQRLFGNDKFTSKTLYRVNALYKAPDYRVGDVVKIGNAIIKITNVGKNLTGMDVTKWKSANIEVKNKAPEKLPIYKVQVSKKHPTLEVLHPKTYDSVPVKNPKKLDDDNADVVISDGNLYLI